MIRFLFRFLGTLLLALAVIMAVLDATRSIVASRIVLTPLAQSWRTASPHSLAALQTTLEAHAGWLWHPVATGILSVPGFVVFAVLALVLYAIGRPRTGRRSRFAAR